MNNGRTHLLPRWGQGVVGDSEPLAELALHLTGQAVSRLQIFPRSVVFDRQRRKGFGIGGVWTASQLRQRGLASALLGLSGGLWRDYDFSILFSLDQLCDFYTNLGWVKVYGSGCDIIATMLQPAARVVAVPTHVSVFVRFFRDAVWPVEKLQIEGLPW